jgi:hypothetical protein
MMSLAEVLSIWSSVHCHAAKNGNKLKIPQCIVMQREFGKLPGKCIILRFRTILSCLVGYGSGGTHWTEEHTKLDLHFRRNGTSNNPFEPEGSEVGEFTTAVTPQQNPTSCETKGRRPMLNRNVRPSHVHFCRNGTVHSPNEVKFCQVGQFNAAQNQPTSM